MYGILYIVKLNFFANSSSRNLIVTNTKEKAIKYIEEQTKDNFYSGIANYVIEEIKEWN